MHIILLSNGWYHQSAGTTGWLWQPIFVDHELSKTCKPLQISLSVYYRRRSGLLFHLNLSSKCLSLRAGYKGITPNYPSLSLILSLSLRAGYTVRTPGYPWIKDSNHSSNNTRAIPREELNSVIENLVLLIQMSLQRQITYLQHILQWNRVFVVWVW